MRTQVLTGNSVQKYMLQATFGFLFLFLFMGSVLAQTAETLPVASAPVTTAEEHTSEEETAVQDALNIVVSARSVAPMEITKDEAMPVKFQLWNFPGAPSGVDTNVTLEGFARTVVIEDQTIAQVIITSVSKDDKTATLDAVGFSSQFDMETSVMSAGYEFDITGNRENLIEALKQLSREEAPDVEVVAGEDVESDNDSSPSSVGGNSSSNDQASGYSSPAAIESEPEPEISVTTLIAGCSVRVDDVQKVAIQQSMTQTFENGALTQESECSDSEVRYPLEQGYAGCTDSIDLSGRKAWPQYTLYYVDPVGTTQTISTCTPDLDQEFAIYEKEDGCTVFTNFASNEAVRQTALVYLNLSNVEQQVQGCLPSPTLSAIPMIETTAGCTVRHEFGEGSSYELTMWTYTKENLVYQATECSDSGTVFPHNTVSTNLNGDYICPTLTNLTDMTVTVQNRTQIEVNGANQYITECTPDTNTTLEVLATTDTCEDPSIWTHDIVAGISYGRERFYFMNNGILEYLTECQTSAETYTHDVQTVGYQYHDNELYAYPYVTIVIHTPIGAYNVRNSTVIAGAPQIPYIYTENLTLETATKTYEGCDAYSETEINEVYARPDDTTYSKPIGAGPTVGPNDVCHYVVDPSWSLISNKTTPSGAVCGHYGREGDLFTQTRTGTYRGYAQKIREDGIEVSNKAYTGTKTCASKCSQPSAVPACSSTSGSSSWVIQHGLQ